MLLLPPTSTLIYPPFPNTTLVRSGLGRTGRRPGRLRLCCLPARCGSWVFLRVGGAHGIAGLAPSLLRNCDGEVGPLGGAEEAAGHLFERVRGGPLPRAQLARCFAGDVAEGARSEEHTSELQSLMRISYAVFCLKKKKITILK